MRVVDLTSLILESSRRARAAAKASCMSNWRSQSHRHGGRRLDHLAQKGKGGIGLADRAKSTRNRPPPDRHLKLLRRVARRRSRSTRAHAPAAEVLTLRGRLHDAGKSTLFNRMTGSPVPGSPLFAHGHTCGSARGRRRAEVYRTRRLHPRLPHDLVAAFRATLAKRRSGRFLRVTPLASNTDDQIERSNRAGDDRRRTNPSDPVAQQVLRGRSSPGVDLDLW